MNPIKIGLLGLGTVGLGTWTVLQRNAEEIARRVGRRIVVKSAAVRDLAKAERHNLAGLTLTTDPYEIIADPEIDVVVELIGGYEPARSLVLAAIAAGKHVVTANKALVALHGEEIFTAATQRGVAVGFEAAVAGSIPVIKALREGLAANRISWLAGIINGTGNFILTEMRDKGRDFADVLAEAQALGYAEADPTFDVEGIDAAHKLTILASLAFGIALRFDAVYTEGIGTLAREDVAYAEALGYRIKHLGIARRSEAGIELRVHPTLIPQQQLLAKVDGVLNAVLVHSDAAGATLYCGAGAGGEPTASAVIADLVDIARNLERDTTGAVPYLAFREDALSMQAPLSIDAIYTAYYVRLEAENRVGVMADVARTLSDHGISIEAIQQKEPRDGCNRVPIILLTHRVQEVRIDRAIAELRALPAITADIVRLRVESLT